MKITEIFASIQGESTLQGLPCVFVRLTGCNLSCRYCDTQYAIDGGVELSIGEVVDRVDAFNINYVCITGGEPLIEKDTSSLAELLFGRGFIVSLETNGTLDISVLSSGIRRIIDVKCPGSGESGRMHPSVLHDVHHGDEFKFVLTDRGDFEFAIDFIRSHDLQGRVPLLLSPASGLLEPAVLADWIVNEAPETRLNLQIHRYIWPLETSGR